MTAFAKALAVELSARKEEMQDRPDTLYIGGGTPSVLPLSVLSDIVTAIRDVHGASNAFREFTVEVNPEDIVSGGPEYVKALLSMGVNRISMGVQSFDDGVLKWMNRRHDSSGAVRAYGILRDAGVRNISLDLIFGLPLMDDVLWNKTLDRILSLDGGLPEHISAYQLSVEEGSALEKLIDSGRCHEAADEDCSRQYDILCARLSEAGYHHYEVSNFALPGYEAVHNSAYWAGRPYLGLGPGAHSYTISGGRHVRSWNPPSVSGYIGAFGPEKDSGRLAEKYRESETLTAEQVMLEKIMLSLRTDSGISETELRSSGDSAAIDRMLDSGDLVRLSDGRLRIPERRFFISDSIIAAIV